MGGGVRVNFMVGDISVDMVGMGKLKLCNVLFISEVLHVILEPNNRLGSGCTNVLRLDAQLNNGDDETFIGG